MFRRTGLWEDHYAFTSLRVSVKRWEEHCEGFRPKTLTIWISQEDDANHNAFFAHDFPNFPVRPSDVLKVKKQPFDNLLILDLEGRDEIVEFPVVWVESHTLKVTHSFHRYFSGRFGKSRELNLSTLNFAKVCETNETSRKKAIRSY